MQGNITQPDQREATFDGASPAYSFERILVPVDFTYASRLALGSAVELSKRFGSRIILFHATGASDNDGFLAGTGSSWTVNDIAASACRMLRSFADNQVPELAGSFTYDSSAHGEVIPSIVNAADRHDATMVVLGTHDDPHHLHFRRTVAERIARELWCSVMFVHAGRARPDTSGPIAR